MNKLQPFGRGLVMLISMAGISFLVAACPAPISAKGELFPTLRLPPKAEIGASSEQVFRAFRVAGMLAQGPWQPAVNEERFRGPAAAVYPRVAPAVVVVRAGRGHGTGALIDPAGWIVTNHHVVANADADASGGLRTIVHLGRMDGDLVRLVEEGLPALVYKLNEDKDLALLKLVQLPEGTQKLPFLELAEKAPRPGSDCVAIGHPSAGLLWTVRSGEVTGIGNWPNDLTDLVTDLLAANSRDRKKLALILAKSPQRRVLVSSCGVNFGDSGGPLVDTQGKLIAVTFAMPKADKGGTARFSYHVHLDEVKAFLAERPTKPLLPGPDPWPAGLFSAFLDLDDDGIPDTLGFGLGGGQPPLGVIIDLKQDAVPRLKPEDLTDSVQRRALRFQFAMHRQPVIRSFYDTDGDGKMDLVLTDSRNAGTADSLMRLVKGAWISEPGQGHKLLNPDLFTDRIVRERFVKIITRLQR